MSRYLQWAVESAGAVIKHQSLHLGEQPAAELCITYARGFEPAWTSIAIYGEKNIQIYPVAAKPYERNADFMDMTSWDWLDRLSALTGDDQYRKLVDGMANVFEDYGFEPRSGLAFFGQEAVFNVRHMGGASHTQGGTPRFKPGLSLPTARLWKHMPDKLSRTFRAAYYGLITRYEHFDYNRFCYYGFRDSDKKPSLKYDSGHVAFAQTASWLIGWWIDDFQRTGHADSLDWAQRMTRKYRAVQSEKTGLIPHWFGNGKSGDPIQNPQPMCNAGDSHTAIAFLEDAALARADARTRALGDELHDLGLRLMRGLCRHGYVKSGKYFPAWLRVVDGAVDESAIVYAFRTQAEKDYWVKKDPRLSAALVYAGDGLFQDGPWTYASGPSLVPALAKALTLTRDPELIAFARELAAEAVAESKSLRGAVNAQNQWTFPAGAGYTKLLIQLHKVTGEQRFLDDAQAMLNRELDALAQPLPEGRPEWWRMPYRTALINAALDLHEATTSK